MHHQYQGWPSGLGSELIIRLRRVQLLHPGFSTVIQSHFMMQTLQPNLLEGFDWLLQIFKRKIWAPCNCFAQYPSIK